jgi:hypothetical protein
MLWELLLLLLQHLLLHIITTRRLVLWLRLLPVKWLSLLIPSL